MCFVNYKWSRAERTCEVNIYHKMRPNCNSILYEDCDPDFFDIDAEIRKLGFYFDRAIPKLTKPRIKELRTTESLDIVDNKNLQRIKTFPYKEDKDRQELNDELEQFGQLLCVQQYVD